MLLFPALTLILVCSGFVQSQTAKLVVSDTKLPLELDSASAVYDGADSIYVIGGRSNYGTQDKIIRYSISGDSVTPFGSFYPTFHATAMLDGDNIHFLGGMYWSYPVRQIYQCSTSSGDCVEANCTLPAHFYDMASVWDPVAKVGYTFGGTGVETGRQQNNLVLRYDPAKQTVVQVATLPDRRDTARAAWTDNGVAYIFGGYNGTWSGDNIFRFDSTTRSVTRLSAKLPDIYGSLYCAGYESGNGLAYVLGQKGVASFDPAAGTSKRIELDSWYYSLRYSTCVYVPKLKRFYIFGGTGKLYSWDAPGQMNHISYVDLN